MNNNNNEVRTLNIEEKRKIEKIMFSDIENAISQLEANTSEEKETEKGRLLKNPPAQIKALAAEYKAVQKKEDDIKKAVATLGFDVDYDGEIKVSYSKSPFSIKKIEDKSDARKSLLEALRRKTTLQLYGGGKITAKLFTDLTEEIKKILNS